MTGAFISTASVNAALRSPIQMLQVQLTRAQTELSTGRHADVGLTLGGRTADAASLHALRTRLDAFANGNAIAATRLTATQSALSTILDTATALQKTVLAASAGTASSQGLSDDAASALSGVVASLNTTAAGQNIFAGINTDVPPIANDAGAGKQSIASAFQSAFGVATGSTGAASITPAAMQAFLDGPFAQQFASPGWQANWSSASDTALTSRVTPTQTATTSISANETALRGTVQVAAMLSQLGLSSLSADTRNVVLTQASAQLGTAVTGIATMQADAGRAQTTVTAATDEMTNAGAFVDTQIGALEDVDPAEVSTRISSLTTQLESAYTLTGKLAQLSLVHYLP